MGVRITEKCDMSFGASGTEVGILHVLKPYFMGALKVWDMREQNENFNARFDFPQPNVKILNWCTLAGATQKHLCSWRFF
jgi:hypothetical protein